MVILYGHQLYGNLQALYTEWQRSFIDEFDCYFLSLDPQYSRRLRSEGIHVLYCGRLRDMLLVGRCSAIITDHGLHAMSPLLSLTDIQFIDVWHGIPFKGFTPADFRVQHRYDEVWVSSPLLKEIYQNKFGFPEHIVRDIGYARADKLFLRHPPDPALRNQVSIPPGDRIVLYAPTWQQDDNGRELFPFGESQDNFIQRLSEICSEHQSTLVIRSHLNARIGEKIFSNVRYCSMKDYPDTESLLQHTDVLICDWSSIAFDYLALNRPTVFLNVTPPFKNGFSLDPKHRFGVVVEDINSLHETLQSILTDPNFYLATYGPKHQKVIRSVYGDNTDGGAALRQLNQLRDLLNQDRSVIGGY